MATGLLGFGRATTEERKQAAAPLPRSPAKTTPPLPTWAPPPIKVTVQAAQPPRPEPPRAPPQPRQPAPPPVRCDPGTLYNPATRTCELLRPTPQSKTPVLPTRQEPVIVQVQTKRAPAEDRPRVAEGSTRRGDTPTTVATTKHVVVEVTPTKLVTRTAPVECRSGLVLDPGTNTCIRPRPTETRERKEPARTSCPTGYVPGSAPGSCVRVVVEEQACPPGQVRDASGACVSRVQRECATGQIRDASGLCIWPPTAQPPPQCEPGYTWDAAKAACSPLCGSGTLWDAITGACVTQGTPSCVEGKTYNRQTGMCEDTAPGNTIPGGNGGGGNGGGDGGGFPPFTTSCEAGQHWDDATQACAAHVVETLPVAPQGMSEGKKWLLGIASAVASGIALKVLLSSGEKKKSGGLSGCGCGR